MPTTEKRSELLSADFYFITLKSDHFFKLLQTGKFLNDINDVLVGITN